jgi:hypothetical protein
MRTAYRTLFLLAVLGVSAGLTTPRPAMSVTCTPVDQACVHCTNGHGGSGFANCTSYECSDGTSRISCSGCGLCI